MRQAKSEAPPAPVPNDVVAPLQAQVDAMLQAQARLLGQIEGFNRAWLSTMREASDASMEFAGRLSRCSDPGDASRLCNEWLLARTSAFVHDGQRLTEMWLRLCGAAIEPAKAASEAPSATAEAAKAGSRRSASAA